MISQDGLPMFNSQAVPVSLRAAMKNSGKRDATRLFHEENIHSDLLTDSYSKYKGIEPRSMNQANPTECSSELTSTQIFIPLALRDHRSIQRQSIQTVKKQITRSLTVTCMQGPQSYPDQFTQSRLLTHSSLMELSPDQETPNSPFRTNKKISHPPNAVFDSQPTNWTPINYCIIKIGKWDLKLKP